MGLPVDSTKADALIVASVGVNDKQPAHSLFGLHGSDFVKEYLACQDEPLRSISQEFD